MKTGRLWMSGMLGLLIVSGVARAGSGTETVGKALQWLNGKTTAETAEVLITETANLLAAEGYHYQISKKTKYDVVFILDKQVSSADINRGFMRQMFGNEQKYQNLARYAVGGDLHGGPVDMRILIKPVVISNEIPYTQNPAIRDPEPKRWFSRMPIILPKGYIKNRLAKPEELYSDGRSVPVFEKNRANGLEFSAIKPGGLWDKMGIKDGDIIQQFDGTNLDIGGTLAAFMETMSSHATFRLTIIRKGVRGIQKYVVQ